MKLCICSVTLLVAHSTLQSSFYNFFILDKPSTIVESQVKLCPKVIEKRRNSQIHVSSYKIDRNLTIQNKHAGGLKPLSGEIQLELSAQVYAWFCTKIENERSFPSHHILIHYTQKVTGTRNHHSNVLNKINYFYGRKKSLLCVSVLVLEKRSKSGIVNKDGSFQTKGALQLNPSVSSLEQSVPMNKVYRIASEVKVISVVR